MDAVGSDLKEGRISNPRAHKDIKGSPVGGQQSFDPRRLSRDIRLFIMLDKN